MQMCEHICPNGDVGSSVLSDCVVFLGKKIMDLKDLADREELNCFQSEAGEPVIISYKSGLFIHCGFS